MLRCTTRKAVLLVDEETRGVPLFPGWVRVALASFLLLDAPPMVSMFVYENGWVVVEGEYDICAVSGDPRRLRCIVRVFSRISCFGTSPALACSCFMPALVPSRYGGGHSVFLLDVVSHAQQGDETYVL